jgi:hypothetical protein
VSFFEKALEELWRLIADIMRALEGLHMLPWFLITCTISYRYSSGYLVVPAWHVTWCLVLKLNKTFVEDGFLHCKLESSQVLGMIGHNHYHIGG